MHALSRIFGALGVHGTGSQKPLQSSDKPTSCSSGDNTHTDDDDIHKCDNVARFSSLGSRTTPTDDRLRTDSGILLDDLPPCRGEIVTDFTFAECPRINHEMEAPEPFPEPDPLILAIAHLDADDPPNIQGLKLENVPVLLQRLRDDPVFGATAACYDGIPLSKWIEVPIHEFDTSVDFASASVSRSSSPASLVCFGEHELPQSLPEEQALPEGQALPEEQTLAEDQPKAVDIMLQISHEGPSDLLKSCEDPYGPRYQLPCESRNDYLKRASARLQATLARHDATNRTKAPSSSSSSTSPRNDDDFSTEDDSYFSPSSPLTPLTPRTPLNRHNLFKLENPDASNGPDAKDSKEASEWNAPHMVGPAIFNISKTKMTPPRKEVYQHIDFCPIDLFYDKGYHRKVVNEQDCLQCVLKNMKCDRFHPCCKRCIRAGEAPYCLHQRRLASWELKQLGLEKIPRYTVLTRLPEDSDETWEEKLRREDALLEELQERIDRRNWVMPVNDGVDDIFDEDEMQGRELCEERGKIWKYQYVDEGLRIVVDQY